MKNTKMFDQTAINKLQKAYTFLRIKGETVMAPAVLDTENNYAYLYTPSQAGPVDVVRYPMTSVLFNALNLMPGFKNIVLNAKSGLPVPMSTKVHTGCFAQVRSEVVEALMTARNELIANGPSVQCS